MFSALSAMCALIPGPRGAPQVPITCLSGGSVFGVLGELHLELFVVLWLWTEMGLLEEKLF